MRQQNLPTAFQNTRQVPSATAKYSGLADNLRRINNKSIVTGCFRIWNPFVELNDRLLTLPSNGLQAHTNDCFAPRARSRTRSAAAAIRVICIDKHMWPDNMTFKYRTGRSDRFRVTDTRQVLGQEGFCVCRRV
jgi:hypothetical protein